MMINIKNKGKFIELNVKKTGKFERGIGLMFKSRMSENLVFDFNRNVGISIHSYFVFFPFLAIWLDEKNNLIESKIVRPFRFRVRPVKNFRRLVEVPINQENTKILDFFVGNREKFK